MDIKDFILIGGGLLIAMVIGHGFWIAYRAKREPLRLDIVPDLIPGHQDEMERLRGELPNGGARVINKHKVSPEQESFDLEVPPVLMEPAEPPLTAEQPAAQTSPRHARERANSISVQQAPAHRTPGPTARVAEVSLDEDESTQQPTGQSARSRAEIQLEIQTESPPGQAPEPALSEPVSARAQRGSLRQRVAQEVKSREEKARTRVRDDRRGDSGEEEDTKERVRVEELLVINVLARKGERFDGEGIVDTLRKQGLRYGDMNIFHRVDPATKAKMYSVANIVEPGTFDLSDLTSMHSPGMSFFLQLPGPEEPMVAFADMLEAARNVALDLGGEMRDEQLSKLTGQTAEHMRQRIADFTRRRLSKRA